MAQLQIPPGWEFVSEEIVDGPCLDMVAACPMVRRVYRVEEKAGFKQDAIGMLAAAGMQTSSTCDPPHDGCHIPGQKGNITITATVIETEENILTVALRAT